MGIRERDHSKALNRELNELLDREEILWKQRSRLDWLKGGDKKTQKFYFKAPQRKKRSRIEGIEDVRGNWQQDPHIVEREFVQYFRTLFSPSNPVDMSSILDTVPRVVIAEMNMMLLRQFNVEDVKIALFQMGPTKAPGPDGMNALFFQKFWHIVGPDVIQVALGFFATGRLLSNLNSTNIMLIPKVKTPTKVSEFRPISLCNVVYKVISKMITNRLQLILPHIIIENQSAFVLGRLITDNILIAFKLLHSMKNTRSGKVGSMALKLDVSKAYDRLEWQYLRGMLDKLGFDQKWIRWVMECVSSISYSITLNGNQCGLINPTRGIRQRDPLSPFLFLYCAEGLSYVLKKGVSDGIISGMVASRLGPKISHIFFADDSVLFCKATSAECSAVQHILRDYKNASGQYMNTQKTMVFFSSNTQPDTRNLIANMFGASLSHQYKKYLGLPSLIGRSKWQSFKSIKERVWNRLQGWK